MSDWVREECVPSKEILQNVLASGHDDFTAMEDIIDNSVEALSSVVGEPGYKPEIKVTISEESIEILDNGCGMSNAQARNAMRLGSHIVQEPSAGSIPHDKTHFLFGSGRLGHFGVGGKAGACKLGNLLEYTTRQNGDSKVTVVRFHPKVSSGAAESLWEQEHLTREPIGEEIKLAHFTKVTISDLKCNPRRSFCYDDTDTFFFRLRARLFCTYFFLINRPGDKFDTEPGSEPPSHRNGLWTLKLALKSHFPDFQQCEPSFSFHLHINGHNILKALKGDDKVEEHCPLNCILNCCHETMIDDAGRVRNENVCNLYHPDSSTPPGATPKAVAICMFDRFVDGQSSFEEQFEQNQMSRLALLDIHNTNLESVRADEAIERKNFRTFVFWRGRLLRFVDMHKTASNPKIPSFLQKRNKVGEAYAPEGWSHHRKDVVEASERVITFVFFNEAFRPDPAKTTLQKDVQPFQSIFETDLYCQRDKQKMAQLLECISYWRMHHDKDVKSSTSRTGKNLHGWEPQPTSSGSVFFRHKATGETRWAAPDAGAVARESEHNSVGSGQARDGSADINGVPGEAASNDDACGLARACLAGMSSTSHTGHGTGRKLDSGNQSALEKLKTIKRARADGSAVDISF